jgi:hypothetical protein
MNMDTLSTVKFGDVESLGEFLSTVIEKVEGKK